MSSLLTQASLGSWLFGFANLYCEAAFGMQTQPGNLLISWRRRSKPLMPLMMLLQLPNNMKTHLLGLTSMPCKRSAMLVIMSTSPQALILQTEQPSLCSQVPRQLLLTHPLISSMLLHPVMTAQGARQHQVSGCLIESTGPTRLQRMHNSSQVCLH